MVYAAGLVPLARRMLQMTWGPKRRITASSGQANLFVAPLFMPFITLSAVQILALPPAFAASDAIAEPGTCSAPQAAARFPKLAKRIGHWEKSRKVRLTRAAHETLLVRYCLAAEPYEIRFRRSQAELDTAAASIVDSQLDRTSNPSATEPDLGILLGGALGYREFREPVPVTVGRIYITYRHSVDQLEVGGDRFPPAPILISETGRQTVTGFSRGKVICRGEVDVQAGTDARFGC